jgi:hypothetical protein
MGFLLEELVGLAVWLLANSVYLRARRAGSGGLQRLLAFWMGLPGTFLCMVLVKEGSKSRLAPPPDDEDALLAEVRRARTLPAGGPPAPGEGIQGRPSTEGGA